MSQIEDERSDKEMGKEELNLKGQMGRTEKSPVISSTTFMPPPLPLSPREKLLESTHYPTDAKTGRGPWNKIVVIGDIHGDMDQAMVLLRETGVITHQPEYYRRLVLSGANETSTNALKKKSKTEESSDGQKGKSSKKGNSLGAKEAQIDNGLGDFIPREVALKLKIGEGGSSGEGASSSSISSHTADEYHWGIGRVLVVVLGDAMNAGPDDIMAVTLMRRLTREADMAGGKLVYVLGNHEVMNLKGDFAGVHPWSYERTGGAAGRRRLLSTETEIGRFLRSRPGIFYYDGLLFMHGGLVPSAIFKVLRSLNPTERKRVLVEREQASNAKDLWKAISNSNNYNGRVDEEDDLAASNLPSGSVSGQGLADTINLHVREALFSNEDQLDSTLSNDPIAETIVNVDYTANGKSGILLVHPLQMCDKIHAANSITSVGAQVVGHTPVTFPNYDYCNSELYAIDMKNSKWKGGAHTLPAALVMLREERAYGAIVAAARPNSASGSGGGSAGGSAAGAVSGGNKSPQNPLAIAGKANSTAPQTNTNSDEEDGYRWSARLVVPKVAIERAQSRVGGWTSVSITGYLLWVAALLALCEVARIVFKILKRRRLVPARVEQSADDASALCDVIASYMPCAAVPEATGHSSRRNSSFRFSGDGGERARLFARSGGRMGGAGGTYRSIDDEDGIPLHDTKSAPF